MLLVISAQQFAALERFRETEEVQLMIRKDELCDCGRQHPLDGLLKTCVL